MIRGFNRDIWLFLCSWSLVAFGYLGIMGVLLNLFLLRLGYGPSFIGLVIGSGQLLWAALALPAAAIGIRIGPRNSMAAGNSLSALGAACIISVEMLPSNWWSGWLVGSWMLMWTGAALHTVNSIPYLMSLSREEERDYAFAAQASAIALFAFLGSVVAGFFPGVVATWRGLSVDLPAPYRLGLWAAPILFLLSAWVITRARPIVLRRRDASSGSGEPRPIGVLVLVALTVFLIAAVEGALRSFFNVYLDTGLALAPSQIGIIMGLGQLLPAAAALTAPVLMAWLGPGLAFSLTSVAAGLFMFPLAFITNWIAAALSFVGIIGATSTSNPARNVFGQLSVGPEWRSAASAATTIGIGLGWASVAAVGGFIIDAWGFAWLFGACALLGIANAIILYAYVRLRRSPEGAPSPAD